MGYKFGIVENDCIRLPFRIELISE